ncbi:hypothetical protein [Prescottella subtropica]|uniref:hypothetical protein n=1 Tax=Prescottella subtropica TaxID=2545757 RepID=UPI0010F53D2E|nr:hypothetical protein [Prescottella subtropica]
MADRVLTVPDPVERANLAAFVARVVRLDEAAVIRMRRRGDGHVSVWAPTGFDALATRVVAGQIRPDDLTAAGDVLARGLAAGGADIDPGFAMDSAWRGALPPDTGFVHVDDVPARVLFDLARRGADLAQQHAGPQGPPTSLLDQTVLDVTGAEGDAAVAVSMRTVFALTAMGFVPETAGHEDEVVRVRASATWLRLDARYGSIHTRRGGGLPLFTT